MKFLLPILFSLCAFAVEVKAQFNAGQYAALGTNWVGVVQVTNLGAARYIVVQAQQAPVVRYHRDLPDLQTGDYGITDIRQAGSEVYVTMAEQAWASAPWLGSELCQLHTWTLEGAQDLVAANDPLGLDVVGGWLPLDSRTQQTTGGPEPHSAFTITFDGGPVAEQMFYRVVRE